eukprot:1160790-Pelagomonas_calceolata.AAC.1
MATLLQIKDQSEGLNPKAPALRPSCYPPAPSLPAAAAAWNARTLLTQQWSIKNTSNSYRWSSFACAAGAGAAAVVVPAAGAAAAAAAVAAESFAAGP